MSTLRILRDFCFTLACLAFGRAAIGLSAALVLSACGPGYSDGICAAECASQIAQEDSRIEVAPREGYWRPGDTVVAEISVFHPRQIERDGQEYYLNLHSVSRVDADEPGVQTEIFVPSDEWYEESHCDSQDPYYVCRRAQLTVRIAADATYIAPIVLQATLLQLSAEYDPVTGESAFVSTSVPIAGRSQSTLTLRKPTFDIAVVPLAKVYATSGFVSVQITRQPGFTDPVQLEFEAPLGTGILGTFVPGPLVPDGTVYTQLRLDLPAHMGAGGTVNLKVTGQSAGEVKSHTFRQVVEPLYTVTVATAGGGPAVLTPARPLDLAVTIAFDPYGPFSTTGPGRIDLTLPDPPPGVTVEWLPDDHPTSIGTAVPAFERTLRLSAPVNGLVGDLTIRATAASLSPDLGSPPAWPFVEAKLPLRVDPALAWDYVSNGVAYFQNANDAIGIGMQSDNRPAVAWLEGPPGGDKTIFLKRFDGAAFVPAPPPSATDKGGLASVGRIEQARMAMSGNDDVHVAFTYLLSGQEGARVGYGLHRRGAAAWTTHDEVSSFPPAEHARSPRIAAGLNDALALSYLVETGIPAGAGLLHVRSRRAVGALAALTGPQTGGSINVSSSGQVLRDTSSIALRADGNPWLAWIEERFSPAVPLPPALWLRGHDGTQWGAPVAVPRTRPLVAAPTQLLVKPDGTLLVAWLEASPARLMLATVDPLVDPLTGIATEVRDARNPDGALNIASDQPARDIALHLDPRGRVVVSWTEGPSSLPRLYAKRLNAAGTWDLLGSAVNTSHPMRSPFLTTDSSGRIYLAWTGFFNLTDLDSVAPRTDVLVGQWIFTEDFVP